MVTKTQRTMEDMNYFLAFKESGGQNTDIYADIFKNLSDIFANQASNGLHTEEAIRNFRETLPGTNQIFDNASMHPDFTSIPAYFDGVVQVSMAEHKIGQEESIGKTM